mmetsp:Transcript_43813/g.121278  ORF Transcript_43813/g.121278 Transcript_43813/m.121278 type:complete len:359 (+) Transcript_43813:2836-3912(+)
MWVEPAELLLYPHLRPAGEQHADPIGQLGKLPRDDGEHLVLEVVLRLIERIDDEQQQPIRIRRLHLGQRLEEEHAEEGEGVRLVELCRELLQICLEQLAVLWQRLCQLVRERPHHSSRIALGHVIVPAEVHGEHDWPTVVPPAELSNDGRLPKSWPTEEHAAAPAPRCIPPPLDVVEHPIARALDEAAPVVGELRHKLDRLQQLLERRQGRSRQQLAKLINLVVEPIHLAVEPIYLSKPRLQLRVNLSRVLLKRLQDLLARLAKEPTHLVAKLANLLLEDLGAHTRLRSHHADRLWIHLRGCNSLFFGLALLSHSFLHLFLDGRLERILALLARVRIARQLVHAHQHLHGSAQPSIEL